jgi:hypothetical protein
MKRPADTTSWQSKTWEQTVQKMQSMEVGAGEEMRSEVSKDELFVIMRTLITADAEDVKRLQEMRILDDQSEEERLELRRVSLKSWKEATDYGAPKSARESQSRYPEEAAAWMEAITGELDWFIENGKVEILNKCTHRVSPAEIPPYKWNAEELLELRLIDLARVDGLVEKQSRAKTRGGGKIDECFDVLTWTWDFVRKMAPVHDSEGRPSACLSQGNTEHV